MDVSVQPKHALLLLCTSLCTDRLPSEPCGEWKHERDREKWNSLQNSPHMLVLSFFIPCHRSPIGIHRSSDRLTLPGTV